MTEPGRVADEWTEAWLGAVAAGEAAMSQRTLARVAAPRS